MFISCLIAATATATKWFTAGKIMTIIGTGLITAAPVVEQKRKERG